MPKANANVPSLPPVGMMIDPHPTLTMLGILAVLSLYSEDKAWLEEAGLLSSILLLEYPLCLIKISTGR